jgi:hypothetical protein
MYIKNYILIILITLFFGCSEERLNEIDTNPNNPMEAPIETLMPSVTSGVPYYMAGSDLSWYASVFVEHTTGTFDRMRDVDRRTGINSKLSENAWLNVYTNVLDDLNTIIERGSIGGEEEGNWKYVGIAQVLFAYTTSIATDLWGRIPYSEALMGANNRTPKYDKQENIYVDLQIMLDSAIANLGKESIATPDAHDMIYGGDTDKWQKAAWALKARFYNHLSNRDPSGSADSALNCIKKAFTSSDDDMIFDAWSGTDEIAHQNPWYGMTAKSPRPLSVSETFYDLLNNSGDPRKILFFTTAGTSLFDPYNPAPNGAADLDASGTKYSKITTEVVDANTPLPLMTYIELLFIKAEASLRVGEYNVAFAAYQDAVLAALEQYGISQTDAFSSPSFYLNVLDIEPGNLTLQDIITQKYIALWPFQSIESYNDWRRTGFPSLNNALGNPPLRMPYPQNEIANNGANVPDVNTSDGVWWDDGTED